MTTAFSPLNFPSRILVVDDDPFVRTVISGLLSAAGALDIKLCASGAEALKEAAAFQPELILLDFLMPDMDGRSTWNELRLELFPMPPVIFLTARNDADFTTDIAALREDNPHICGILFKPFNPATVVGEIARLLARAERRPQRAPAAKTRRLAAVADAFRRSLPATTDRMSGNWAKVREAGWSRGAAEAILADAHSLAGSAGLFDLNGISTAAHETERLLLNALKADRAPTASEFRTVANAVTSLIAACRAAAPA